MEIWRLPHDGTLEGRSETLPATLPQEGFLWIDCHSQDLQTVLPWLKNTAGLELDERHLSDCHNRHHPSFFDQMEDYQIIIFRNLRSATLTSPIETRSIALVMFPNILLTVHDRDPMMVQIKTRLHGKHVIIHDLESVVCLLLNNIIDNFLMLRTAFDNDFIKWQTALFKERHQLTDWSNLLKFKTTIHKLIMVCEEQLDAIGQWHHATDTVAPTQLTVRQRDLDDHARRMLRFLIQIDKQLDSLLQLHFLIVGNRTNEIMRILTVVSCIFMPLTLITGFFGMNFQKMDFLRNPHGVHVTFIAMGIITVGMLLIFAWKKWL